ncbi:MAG: type IX secretion system sortase PorU [Bacteroidales bacterium]|nr:type IX secretion system sortase PorU [Bacteroidales bacterium]
MKKLVFFVFLHLSIALAAQVEFVVIQWDISHDQPFFPHALYADGENTLPYITRKLPWSSDGKLPVVHLKVNETAPLGEDSGLQTYTHHVKEAPLLEYSLVREAKQSFIMVKVLPFLRNVSGGLERVKSFELHISRETPLAALKSSITGDWATGSVLASGDWFRISVLQTGMHKLTYEKLQEIGLQNPASVRVYGSGARLLPENFSAGHVDDLRSIPVHMHRGSDGMFGPGDHILFYAQGPASWNYVEEDDMFIHRLHPYSWKGYYFLTDSKGSVHTPEEAELSTEAPAHTVSEYDFRWYFEEETYNLIKSGRKWYGDNFNINLEGNYPLAIPERIDGEDAKIRVVAAARSNVTSSFVIKANNQQLGSMEINRTDLSTYTATYAYEQSEVFKYAPTQDNLTVTVEYQRPNSNSEGWLNSITVNGRSSLDMAGDAMDFRDTRSAGPGNVSEFRLEKANSNTVIWEISDPGEPRKIPHTLSGSTAIFRLETNEIREFIAFDTDGDYYTPNYTDEGLGAMENQDLHGLQHPDMIIITPEIFRESAQDLADHREANDGLDVAVVLQQQVFNEFSSGTPDVTAIRNFLKMFYDRSGGSEDYCRYLLLFGDGSYDNRNKTIFNPNLLLTYQSENSLSPTRSYVSDDFFGLLDTDESMYNGLLDIGIGRFPVSTTEEASDLVDKIISYSDPACQGEWRNQLCFIGDDEDSNIHMRQADQLASYVNTNYPGYNINKVYLDAYQQEKVATGFRYPEVTRAINDQMNRGALILNYTGHGGSQGLAHERIVTINEINSWTNREMLPLFMTATCEFSRYDEYDHKLDQEITSAGEEVLLNTEGGGIGLFTTTRLVYSGPNHVLNERFYEVVFEKDENQQNYRLGDIIAYSKNNTGSGINKRNFTLLGDPSMRLAYPKHSVVTDSINGVEVTLQPDTLSAFDWVTVSGHLETESGSFMDGFNGIVYPVVFDKEKKVETLSNDDDPVWSFKARNSILYSGKATVTDGRFTFGFYVPKDINYAIGPGKISYYSNDSQLDAHGSFEDFLVGGIGSENVSDTQPPRMDLFMNDSFFVSGGLTDPDPALLVYVTDNFGVNTTGNGIGHDLTATLDNDRINAIILNEFYQANTNSYNSGVIRYPYSNLENGRHEITVKIWDIHNNSAESSLEFIVADSEEMLLEQLYNYPNPFFDQTWFNIEHNRPDRELRLVLTIHSLSGQMVRIIDTRIFSGGYRLDPVMWDGTSSGGNRLGGGVYIYRATLSTDDGEMASESGKLIIAR